MKAKVVVQGVLLAVVGASVVAWALRLGTPPAPANAPAAVIADGVAVIHFHGTRR